MYIYHQLNGDIIILRELIKNRIKPKTTDSVFFFAISSFGHKVVRIGIEWRVQID